MVGSRSTIAARFGKNSVSTSKGLEIITLQCSATFDQMDSSLSAVKHKPLFICRNGRTGSNITALLKSCRSFWVLEYSILKVCTNRLSGCGFNCIRISCDKLGASDTWYSEDLSCLRLVPTVCFNKSIFSSLTDAMRMLSGEELTRRRVIVIVCTGALRSNKGCTFNPTLRKVSWCSSKVSSRHPAFQRWVSNSLPAWSTHLC